MDKLSNLPDPILLHVLSFLPTKTSIACGALSKRWQHLWTCVPVLDLDVVRDMPRLRYADNFQERENKEKEMASRFLKIVDEVYSLPRDFHVKKLRLSVRINQPCDTKNHLHKWIKAGRFEELDLAVRKEVFTFPKSYCSNMVVVLKLSDSKLGSVESCHFPTLRVLHLLGVSLKDKYGGSIEKFLSACPILEELSCENLKIHDNTSFMICVPTLTSLVLRNEDCYFSDCYACKFVLETPALEYLSFKHAIASDDSLVTRTSLCNVRKADITCLLSRNHRSYGSFVMKLLKNLPSVQLLKLSIPLTRSNRRFNSWDGVVYGLVRFEFCIPSRDCVLLLHLLKKFHNLRYISIDKVRDFAEAEVRWREPRQVPICLSSSLSSFCFRGFEGFKVELELVKYVKKHAKVLKSMTIETSSCYKASEARIDAARELPEVLSGDKACEFRMI